MAFILSAGNVISFADADDVRLSDSRFFDANEGITDAVIEDLLERSTDRIVLKLKASSWWRTYNSITVSATLGAYDVPTPNKNRFQRRADITDLCVFHCLAEYLYPKYADFGNETSSEVQKIRWVKDKFLTLWEELLAAGDFYDDDGDGSVETEEKLIVPQLRRRTRGRRSIAVVK